MKTWYRMQAQAEDNSVVDIHIIDFIGDWIDDWIARNWGYDMGVTAKAFVDELSKLPANVMHANVYINSPGGDVMGGINIANAMREWQKNGRTMDTHIVGLAASIASVIAMAGKRVFIADNALMMIHEPWAGPVGNSKELRKTADLLDQIRDDQIVTTYKWHSSLEQAEIVALMEAETWMSADEAIEKGFATDKTEGLKAAASIDPRGIKALKVPEQFKARVDALIAKPAPVAQPAAALDVVRMCREGGVSDIAEALLAENATLDQVKAQVQAKKTERSAAAARETEIRALCKNAKREDLANSYVSGGMTVEGVRAQLTTITALLDQAAINTGLPPDHGNKPKARIDTQAVYAQLNGETKEK